MIEVKDAEKLSVRTRVRIKLVILVGEDPPELGSIWRSTLSVAIALPQQAQVYFQSARKLTTFAVHHRNHV